MLSRLTDTEESAVVVDEADPCLPPFSAHVVVGNGHACMYV